MWRRGGGKKDVGEGLRVNRRMTVGNQSVYWGRGEQGGRKRRLLRRKRGDEVEGEDMRLDWEGEDVVTVVADGRSSGGRPWLRPRDGIDACDGRFSDRTRCAWPIAWRVSHEIRVR
jgi:hypothetical protein